MKMELSLAEDRKKFVLPTKNRWILLGSGPSLDYYNPHPFGFDEGILALNDVAAFLPVSSICIPSHYESVIGTISRWHECPQIYLSDPMHVGVRCLPISLINLFVEPWLKYTNNVFFYRKENDFERAMQNERSLFAGPTVANIALHLLYLNGIDEVIIYGIDGGTGRAELVKKNYDWFDKMAVIHYDEAKDVFLKTAKKFGIKVIEGARINA